MDLSDYAEPLPTELEQIVDEARRDCGLGPAPRAAATGLADMDARIEYFTTLLAKLKSQVGGRESSSSSSSSSLQKLIADTERDLREASARRAEYQVQQQNLN